ncbi:hypothetical protein KL944_005232 [Ogataea haglerorum]|nr:hypothetical protein KL944_005232 [Ogataea haglerorum]
MAMLNHAWETNAIEESILVEQYLAIWTTLSEMKQTTAQDIAELDMCASAYLELQEEVSSADQKPYGPAGRPQQDQHESVFPRLDAAGPRGLSELHPYGRGSPAADHEHLRDAGTKMATEHRRRAQGRRPVDLGALRHKYRGAGEPGGRIEIGARRR